MKRVLFACVHNAGRSQMAAAFFNELVDPTKAHAVSAGTDPAPHVHPQVVEAMREAGIDLTHATTTTLTPDIAQGVDVLITMGCEERCPVVPGTMRYDWRLDDPGGKPVEQVRVIRDAIQHRVLELITDQHWLR